MDPAVYDPEAIGADAFARANHTGTQSADTITDGTTNKVFTATEQTKLAGIEEGADVTADALVAATDASGFGFVNSAGPLADSGTTLASESVVKAYADTKQPADVNLTALSSGTTTLGTTGLSLLGDETAADARSTLGLGTAATLNSGDASGNLKELNADGGFAFSGATGPINANTTITGTGTTGLYEFNHGHFGGLFDGARARTVFNNTTDTGLSAETGPRFAVAISHESEGNTNSLAGNTHCGLWVFGGKKDWLTNTNEGDHSATYFMTQNGRKGNGASINMAAYKVFTGDTGVDEGGAMCFEGAGVKVNTSGATTDQVQIYGGYVMDGGAASATHPLHQKLVGFSTEYQAGTSGYAAFAAISRVNASGAPKWENIITALTDRNGTEYFRITGNGHTDGAGLVQAGAGSVSRPGISFLANPGVGIWRPSTNNMAFSTNGVEQARIDASGNLLVGTSAAFIPTVGTQDGWTIQKTGIIHASTSGASLLNLRRQVSDGSVETFYRDTTAVGSISVTAAATAFNTSSDGRLKTNRLPIENSGTVIDAIEPVTFDWTHVEGAKGVGFIAQDLAQIVPEAVTAGDDDPEIVSEQWQVDMSKLVPYLVAEIKALRARVADLEASAPASA